MIFLSLVFCILLLNSELLGDEIQKLLNELKSKDELKRWNASFDLSEIRRKFINEICEIAEDESIPINEKMAAISLFGDYRDEDGVDILVENIEYYKPVSIQDEDYHYTLDYPCARTLIKIGLPSVKSVLSYLLYDESKNPILGCEIILEIFENSLGQETTFGKKLLLKKFKDYLESNPEEETKKYIKKLTEYVNSEDRSKLFEENEKRIYGSESDINNNNTNKKTETEDGYKTTSKSTIENNNKNITTKSTSNNISKYEEKTESKDNTRHNNDTISIKPAWIIAIVGLIIIGLQIVIIFRRK